MSAKARHFTCEPGPHGYELVEIPERVFFDLMMAPADGVYDDAFYERSREHQRRVMDEWRKEQDNG